MSQGERDHIQVVIADDHPVVREGLRSLILTAADMEVVGEAGTGAEAVERAQALQPEVMLLDIRMPGGNGLAVLERIKTVSPDTSVIMVTMHDDPDYISRAIAAGAAGYVLKEASRQDFLTAIRTVLKPSAAPTPVLLSKTQRAAFNAAQASAPSGAVSISPVERELLLLLADGLSNREISAQLHCSLGTVKNYLQNLFNTLQVSDRTRAVVEAIRLGLIEP